MTCPTTIARRADSSGRQVGGRDPARKTPHPARRGAAPTRRRVDPWFPATLRKPKSSGHLAAGVGTAFADARRQRNRPTGGVADGHHARGVLRGARPDPAPQRRRSRRGGCDDGGEHITVSRSNSKVPLGHFRCRQSARNRCPPKRCAPGCRDVNRSRPAGGNRAGPRLVEASRRCSRGGHAAWTRGPTARAFGKPSRTKRQPRIKREKPLEFGGSVQEGSRPPHRPPPHPVGRPTPVGGRRDDVAKTPWKFGGDSGFSSSRGSPWKTPWQVHCSRPGFDVFGLGRADAATPGWHLLGPAASQGHRVGPGSWARARTDIEIPLAGTANLRRLADVAAKRAEAD